MAKQYRYLLCLLSVYFVGPFLLTPRIISLIAICCEELSARSVHEGPLPLPPQLLSNISCLLSISLLALCPIDMTEAKWVCFAKNREEQQGDEGESLATSQFFRQLTMCRLALVGRSSSFALDL